MLSDFASSLTATFAHVDRGALIVVATAIFGATSIALEVLLAAVRRTPRTIPLLDPKEAKRRAKKENERTKLTASFLNGIGIAVLLATAIMPIFRSFGAHPEPVSWPQALAGVGVGFGFHLLALWMLSFWRSED